MKRAAILLPSILLAASITLAPAANAAGMILIDPMTPMPPHVTPVPVSIAPGIMPITPTPHPTPRPTTPLLRGSVTYGLRLQSADVKVDVTDNVAKTFVSQTFVNDTDRNVAGTYLFPLPKDTTFSSFSLMIDGKPVEGKILEATEARTEYENIVRRMVDPGLLEYADYKTVRARIFPIPAHGTKKVELEYTQLLGAENGMLAYRFPLKTQGAEESDELKVTVKLNSKQGLRTIWSPSHTIATKRDDDHHAKVEFDAKNALPDKDFFLYYSLSDKDIAANVVTNKIAGDDGYFLLTLTPPVETKAVAAKDIVLVADTSGSMAGERLKQNKQALKYIINALNPQDRFSIVQFNTDVDSFKLHLVQATPENKKAALSFVEDMDARGGTDIGDALKTALSLLDTSDDKTRAGFLVLMTDGEPTVGETTIPGLLKTVNSKRDIRLFDFGVGYDVNTKLLDRLAEAHHGTSHYVEPSESFETSLSNFYNKIQKPVLTDVKIAYDGLQVKDIYPREVKDIFAGSQVLLLGRYKNGGDATVKLTGNINGVQKAYSFPVKFAGQEVDHTYLPRMWAMRRIAHLTDVARDNGDSKEVVDEIISLSKRYGIISEYTSFLVTDPSEPSSNFAQPWVRGTGAGTPVGVHGRLLNRWDGVSGAAAGSPFAMGREMNLRSATTGTIGPIDGATTFGALPAVSMGASLRTPGDNAYAHVSSKARQVAQFYSSPREIQVLDEHPIVRDFREAPAVGQKAISLAKDKERMKSEVAISADEKAGLKNVDDKTFFLRDGVWIDTQYNEKTSPKPIEITFGSKEYFDLVKQPGAAKLMSVGRQVIFVLNGKTYKIVYHEQA
ncbi:MAG TPA: VIT domain-containing protein [Candidatus Obscuribacterales bacterium]